MKTLDEWVNELKDWDSPVMRRTVLDFGKLAARMEKVSADQIADVVLRDPLMTLKVLRLVNGASRSRLRSEITTIEHAVMMLGIGPFFSRLANLKSIEESFSPANGAALQELMRVLSRAHHAAWQARDWAILRKDMKSEEVYIGAFLYDLGEIVLWAHAPNLATEARRLARRTKMSQADAVKVVLGFDLREFQFALAEKWKLPELMQAFMHSESASRPRMLGVIMAASVARHAESGWYGAQLPADYEVLSGLLLLPFDETVSLVHHNAVVSARHWEWYGVPPAAAWLPMLPGEWPEEPGDVEPEAPRGKNLNPASEACPPPNADVLRRVMAEIGRHPEGTLRLHDMMKLAMKGMREGIGLNRVVLALMDEDFNALKAKYVVGAEPDSPLRQFHVDMAVPQLFSRLMEKAQGVWFNEANRRALEPIIPERVWGLIGRGEFFAMSVFVSGKPAGLFYADRKPGKSKLDDPSYQDFKRLCLHVGKGLAPQEKT